MRTFATTFAVLLIASLSGSFAQPRGYDAQYQQVTGTNRTGTPDPNQCLPGDQRPTTASSNYERKEYGRGKCSKYPAGVCAACGNNPSDASGRCQEAKAYYCGQLGWPCG